MRYARAVRARWAGLSRPDRIAIGCLGALLAAGAALRLLAMLAYRPALIGYYDTPVYIAGAQGSLFGDPLRAAGYSFFLRIMHGLSEDLSFTTLVQHGLGMASALLLYAAVRRGGGPRWAALLPAAVMLLGGDQLLFEHALLSEALYTFLTAAGLYLAVRCLDGAIWGWPAATGIVLGLASTVRLAGLLLIPLVILWLLAMSPGTRIDRLARASLACAGSATVLLTYLAFAHAETDRWSFSRHGAYNFYGRVSSFADCHEFDPPAGTEALCDETPPHERNIPQWYIFNGPVVGLFGEPQLGRPSEEGLDKIEQFSRRAAVAQPVGWADAALRDFARYVFPNSFERPIDSGTALEYRDAVSDEGRTAATVGAVAGYWSTPGLYRREGLHDAVVDYENATRVEGPPMAILLLLATLGPVLCRGRERRAALLLGGIGIAMLAVPVVTINYDGRLGMPAYGPLAAGAAFGGLALVRAFASRLPSSAA